MRSTADATRAETRPDLAGGGAHLVTFYESDAELAETVGRFLRDAMRSEAAAVVIATEEHRRAFERELTAPAVDHSRADGGFAPVWLDARWVLARIVSGDRVDGAAFHRVVGPLVRTAAETGRPVRAYGEMVALLWEDGNVLAAVELERLWNELGAEVTFTLLCAYAAASVTTGEDPSEALREVCGLHTHVVHAPDRDEDCSPDAEGLPAVCAHLSPTRTAPGAARRMVADALRRRGCDGELVYDAQLVVTELATNAVLHARTPFWVVAHIGDHVARIAVQDDSRAEPRMRRAPPTATSGRGLPLIDLLARQRGVAVTSRGKVVHADLERVREPASST